MGATKKGSRAQKAGLSSCIKAAPLHRHFIQFEPDSPKPSVGKHAAVGHLRHNGDSELCYNGDSERKGRGEATFRVLSMTFHP